MKLKYVFPLLFLLLSGCTSRPVFNVTNEYVPTLPNGSYATVDQVEKAILSAAYDRGWKPRLIEPGLIEARIEVRSHSAIVDIPYTDKFYDIRYRESSNLNYSDGSIHKNYNKWIRNLSSSIQKQLSLSVY